MTSCTWDYVSQNPASRSYTMMLCCFVFFIPLAVILYCYLLMFLSVRQAGRCVLLAALQSDWWTIERVTVFFVFRDLKRLSQKSGYVKQQSMKSEWRLAKIAALVIVVYVLSWAPYACVTLVAWAGWAHNHTHTNLCTHVESNIRFTQTFTDVWDVHTPTLTSENGFGVNCYSFINASYFFIH